MRTEDFCRAVDALVEARRDGVRVASLPPGAQPGSLAEALAIQGTVVQRLGEDVAGWKVAASPNGVMRGAILGSRVWSSPAAAAPVDEPLLGIEGEIAFVLRHDLPPRPIDYTAAEVAEVVTAMVGIEVVGTRFLDYDRAPLLDRAADCMSNYGYVTGTVREDWRDFELPKLEAVLRLNGEEVVRQAGGLAAGDPMVPAVLLVNALRMTVGVRAGQFITTGTYTGMRRVHAGDSIEVEFPGFGQAAIALGA